MRRDEEKSANVGMDRGGRSMRRSARWKGLERAENEKRVKIEGRGKVRTLERFFIADYRLVDRADSVSFSNKPSYLFAKFTIPAYLRVASIDFNSSHNTIKESWKFPMFPLPPPNLFESKKLMHLENREFGKINNNTTS